MGMFSSYCHLGHVITNSLDDGPDIVNSHSVCLVLCVRFYNKEINVAITVQLLYI